MRTTLLNRAWRVGVTAVVLSLAGCVTDDQVKRIVSDSNVASLSAQLDLGDVNAAGTGSAGNWQEASQKIETIIAANPEQVATNAALRVRQAMMLLQNRQYNLATAAFAEASLDDLHTARDRAFKQLAPQLVWWYRSAGSVDALDEATVKTAQAAIDRVMKELEATPEASKLNESVHDWLAAMRAFIGVRMANDAYPVTKARAYLEDAINGFAASVSAGETATWTTEETAPNKWPPDGMSIEVAVSGTNRRHFTAQSLIEAAKIAMKDNTITDVQVNDPYFQQRLAQ